MFQHCALSSDALAGALLNGAQACDTVPQMRTVFSIGSYRCVQMGTDRFGEATPQMSVHYIYHIDPKP